MLECNIEWTRRGLLFWEGRIGQMVWCRVGDPDLFPRMAIALTVGLSAAKCALPYHQ